MSLWMLQTETSRLWKVRNAIILLGWRYECLHINGFIFIVLYSWNIVNLFDHPNNFLNLFDHPNKLHSTWNIPSFMHSCSQNILLILGLVLPGRTEEFLSKINCRTVEILNFLLNIREQEKDSINVINAANGRQITVCLWTCILQFSNTQFSNSYMFVQTSSITICGECKSSYPSCDIGSNVEW